MKPITARELKNSTGEVVRTLRRGERQAWAEIEAQLRQSRPRFASWQEAEDQSRGRQ